MTTAADPLIQYLRQLQAHGTTHVNVDDDARVFLRHFYRRAAGQASSTRTATATRPAPSSQSTQARTPSGTPAASATTTGTPQPPTAAPISPAPVQLQVTGATPEEKINSLKQQAREWAPAIALRSLRDTMVFSSGNPNADIMVVGEAPGFDEERLLQPFSGKAGQKLDGILKAMGTSRQAIYISNIVKFRPKMPNQTTSNRKPTPEELNVWLPFIKEEVSIVQPKVIIAMGATAAQGLLGVTQRVGELRETFHQFNQVPVRVTYHPSFILNEGVTPEKRMLWLDMLSVMEKLNMPISDKQRGYFA